MSFRGVLQPALIWFGVTQRSRFLATHVEASMAGDRKCHCVAARQEKGTIAVATIDPAAGTVVLTEVAPTVPGEQVIFYGIAITHGHVVITMTAGRLLALHKP